MLNLIRNSTHHLRLWLIAAIAVLVFTSIIEAGHIHGTFAETDNHCALCQHSASLDKALTTNTNFVAPLFLTLFSVLVLTHFAATLAYRFAPIRAPVSYTHLTLPTM
jgi:hypothetical protein